MVWDKKRKKYVLWNTQKNMFNKKCKKIVHTSFRYLIVESEYPMAHVIMWLQVKLTVY